MAEKTINHATQYTQVFLDFLEDNPTFLDYFQLDTQEHTNKFKTMLAAKWGIYEIGGETVPLFEIYIHNKFNVIKDYYIELINAYETKIEMLDGNKEVIIETYDKTDSGSGNSNNTFIALPNKREATEYPTNKDKNETEYEDTTTTTRNITRTGRINVIELKRDYMKLLRNVYEEFVDKFKECFIMIY